MRQLKREVKIGNVTIGGNNPIAVQTMLNVPVEDIEGNVAQAKRCEAAGCQILRVTCPSAADAKCIEAVKNAVNIPIVADIHFDYKAALACADVGVDKIRINPGNIGDDDRVKAVVDACQQKNIPIRIGVNGGSLEKHILAKYGAPTPEAMVESALYHVRLLEKFDFNNIVISIKNSNVPRMMEAIGVDAFYNNKWGALGDEIVNPIGCADCHEPENMNLHISRPALIEAFERQGKDITKATPQEMRSLVCAQCHVEYYFKGDGKYLTFPWDKGFTVEDMEAYYDEAGFYDYIHKLSRTPILKAQHPDFEIAQMGIHGQRGVSCADCHMPYKSEGGVKFSDHHIQSPLAMIDRTCQTCHRESEETLRNNVYERQRKANEIRNRLEQELAKAHIEAKFAWDKGATEEQMKDVLALIRQAQWRWDFGVASHGGSFHAPQEIQRVLSHGLDRAMQARLAISKVLAKHGYTDNVPMPDISTKDKAQEYIGLDMDAERAAKDNFLKTTAPAWLEKAKANNRLALK